MVCKMRHALLCCKRGFSFWLTELNVQRTFFWHTKQIVGDADDGISGEGALLAKNTTTNFNNNTQTYTHRSQTDRLNNINNMSSSSSVTTRTFPKQASSLKKGDFIIIQEQPCKVTEITFAKTGKHGHAKASITATNIFNGKRLEDGCPSTANVDCPEVVRNDYDLLDITDDDYLTLLNADGEEKNDLKVPADEVGAKIKEMFAKDLELIVTVQQAFGIEQAIDVKESK